MYPAVLGFEPSTRSCHNNGCLCGSILRVQKRSCGRIHRPTVARWIKTLSAQITKYLYPVMQNMSEYPRICTSPALRGHLVYHWYSSPTLEAVAEHMVRVGRLSWSSQYSISLL